MRSSGRSRLAVALALALTLLVTAAPARAGAPPSAGAAEIGEVAFARLERAWAQRYRGRSASTRDFIALASRVAGRDLTSFLEEWLYGTTTPPMPGHPDWTVNPVEQPAPTASLAQAGGRSIPHR